MAHVETFERKDGRFDWRMVGDNDEKMCGSVQSYTERNDAEEGFRRVEAVIAYAVRANPGGRMDVREADR